MDECNEDKCILNASELWLIDEIISSYHDNNINQKIKDIMKKHTDLIFLKIKKLNDLAKQAG